MNCSSDLRLPASQKTIIFVVPESLCRHERTRLWRTGQAKTRKRRQDTTMTGQRRGAAKSGGGGRGFSNLKGGPFPDPGNSPSRGVRASYCAFFAILVTFFFSSLFRCLFGSIFAPFSTPTWLPKSTKIDEKSMPRCLPMLTSFFDRFLIDFYSQLGPPEPSKYRFFLRKNKVFSKKAFSQLIPIFDGFWCQLGSIFPPKIHQNPSKNRSQDASNF